LAPSAYHRGARAGVGALQAVFRRRAGSALLASGILEKDNHSVLRRRRFRRLWRLGRAALAGSRTAAVVSPLHRREPQGFSGPRRENTFHGTGAGLGIARPNDVRG